MSESVTGNSGSFPTSTTVPSTGDIQAASNIKTPVQDLMDRTEWLKDNLQATHHDGIISPKIDLTTDVVGVLPVGNGGTGGGSTDADTLDGFNSNTGTAANTIPVRNGSGDLPGNITGQSQETFAIEDNDTPGTFRVASSGTDPNTVVIRDGSGSIPGGIANATNSDFLKEINSGLYRQAYNTVVNNGIVTRNGSGLVPGDITGNSATTTLASNSSQLGGVAAANYALKADELLTATFEFSGEYPSLFTNVGPIFVAPYAIQLLSALLIVEYEGDGGGFTEVDVLAKVPAGSPTTIFSGSGKPRVGGGNASFGMSSDGGTGDRAFVFATTTFVTDTLFYCNITSGASHPPTANPVSGTLLLRYKRQ